MSIVTVRYEHHGKEVSVQPHLKGKHREHNLCFGCANFKPGEEDNCAIAKAVYQNCVEHNIVSPIWECPQFKAN